MTKAETISKTETDKICKNCKWWVIENEECGNLNVIDNIIIMSEIQVMFAFAPDRNTFGCNQWEERDE